MALEGQGRGAFPQQGAVDWTLLASRTASFTIDVLSRLSAANVDPYTLEVGRAISKQFSISRDGRKNVSDAVEKLSSHSAFGNVLWFGFGVRHVVRILPSTDEGLTCLALCGLLADYYDEDTASEVLHELVKKSASSRAIHTLSPPVEKLDPVLFRSVL